MDDKWIMRGPDAGDSDCVKSPDALLTYIEEIGFLPLFRNEVPGFSVEEHVDPSAWWTDDPLNDPWCWRMTLARSGMVAYGKFFGGRSGFVSKDWFGRFACFRRDGYDFDSRADEGLARREDIKLMSLMDKKAVWNANELKAASGLDKRFEPTITRLMQQTYVTICDFTQKINKKGQPYGWHMSVYTTPEALWGDELVRGAYDLSAEACKDEIQHKLKQYFPHGDFSKTMCF